jgi:hypothetical protein
MTAGSEEGRVVLVLAIEGKIPNVVCVVVLEEVVAPARRRGLARDNEGGGEGSVGEEEESAGEHGGEVDEKEAKSNESGKEKSERRDVCLLFVVDGK